MSETGLIICRLLALYLALVWSGVLLAIAAEHAGRVPCKDMWIAAAMAIVCWLSFIIF